MAKSARKRVYASALASSTEPETITAASSTPGTEQGETALEDLFLDSIKDIYWAENHLVKTIPKMLKAAGSAELQKAFTDHLEVTKEHVVRLQQIFDLMGKKAQAKKCDAMEGISMEGEGLIEDTIAGTPARDLALIMAAQKAEHYEISVYSGLSQFAKSLGKNDVAAILDTTLADEKEASSLLTSIAETGIDYQTA